MARTTIVVPCYNEASRLAPESFDRALAANPELEIFFVNDGSTDDTLTLLRDIEKSHHGRVRAIDQPINAGKAEAVRLGMLAGFGGDADFVGYWDADLATPLDEVPRFVEIFRTRPELEVVIGSRVKLLGHSIKRHATRHYLGRIGATITSIALRLDVYDTQCGAKIFRNQDNLRRLFEVPFRSGWIFDVEILARLIRDRRDRGCSEAASVLFELPLNQWHDVAGSTVPASAFLHGLIQVVGIHFRYLR
jgi:dolichyl-phosphate beta-glucosyltransferase